jgi:hypothetical protein
MAYIGRPLQVANLAVQSGTGDGSDTTPIATLNYATTTNGIAVYLDGVRQLAGTDFNVTNQTTLTFTTAPANGVGIDVYFLGLELSLPVPSDASVTSAKIGNDQVDSQHYVAGSIDLEHMSSESVDEDNLHISNAGSNGQFLSKQSGDAGGLTWASVSSPAEGCNFLVTNDHVYNITGNNTTYTCAFNTEISDVGSNFNTGTYTFTAPATGMYLLSASVKIHGLTAGTTDLINVSIVTSNRSYVVTWEGSDLRYNETICGVASVADMDVSDTAYVSLRVNGNGSDTADFKSGSYFSGFRIS